MNNREKKSPPSLNAFIKQLAKQLRSAVKSSSLEGRITKEKNGLSTPNKIEQIALLLRSKVKKLQPKKKKSH